MLALFRSSFAGSENPTRHTRAGLRASHPSRLRLMRVMRHHRDGPAARGISLRATVEMPTKGLHGRDVLLRHRAEGPRHRRPRLRHEAHRRGEASAASRPPQARARVVAKVRLSAQPPADRSVQRLIQRRRWTAPAHGWAARPRSCPPSARQRARTDAAPCLTDPPPKGHSGKHRRRCALPVRLIPVTPIPPPGGSADRCRSWR